MKIKTIIGFNKLNKGTGKVWLAKIKGIDKKFGYKRDFVQDREIIKSKTIRDYWNYFYTIKNDGYYQFYQQNKLEVNITFFKINEGKKKILTEEEFLKEVSP